MKARFAIGVSMFSLTILASNPLGMRTTEAADLSDMILFNAPVKAVSNCVDCVICQVGGSVGHKAYEGDLSSIYEYGVGPHTDCWDTGGCSVMHPPTCTPQFDQAVALLEEIRQAVVTANLGKIRAILLSNPTIAAHIPDRHAIQVYGCQGTVLAHLPLHAELENEL